MILVKLNIKKYYDEKNLLHILVNHGTRLHIWFHSAQNLRHNKNIRSEHNIVHLFVKGIYRIYLYISIKYDQSN